MLKKLLCCLRWQLLLTEKVNRDNAFADTQNHYSINNNSSCITYYTNNILCKKIKHNKRNKNK